MKINLTISTKPLSKMHMHLIPVFSTLHINLTKHFISAAALFLLFILNGCGGGSSTNSPPGDTPAPESYDLTVLMLGNSHSSSGDLPEQLSSILSAHEPQKKILVQKAVRSLFLEEHINDENTMALFEERHWDYVILQAQKYSVSQSVYYSTLAAEEFIRRTKAKGGTPILFPEWSQVGYTNESQYIYDIHLGIIENEPACLAPIGFAWDKTLMINPVVPLHASDGNHASETGAYLTAMVLFQTITSFPAELLGVLNFSDISEENQVFLQAMASQTIAVYPPCETLEE